MKTFLLKKILANNYPGKAGRGNFFMPQEWRLSQTKIIEESGVALLHRN